jgi:hypothetical protein
LFEKIFLDKGSLLLGATETEDKSGSPRKEAAARDEELRKKVEREAAYGEGDGDG